MPSVQITSLTGIAITVGANRIVPGSGIDHPLGNPELGPDRERTLRKSILNAAIKALETEVKEPTVFQV